MNSKALQKTTETTKHEDLIQLVSFNLDNEEYGIEVLKVREIIRMPDITRIPNAPHYVEGVINLRGKIIPIISMRKKFGHPEHESCKQTRIMVTDIGGTIIGFIVDAVSEVIRVPNNEIQPAPSIVSGDMGADVDCITGVVNQSDRLLVLIDLEKLFSSDRTFLENQ